MTESEINEDDYTADEWAETLRTLVENLLDNMVMAPPEFNKIVDDHFWELF